MNDPRETEPRDTSSSKDAKAPEKKRDDEPESREPELESREPELESREPEPGSGALCSQAQADGVPCFELGRDCAVCEKARPPKDENPAIDW